MFCRAPVQRRLGQQMGGFHGAILSKPANLGAGIGRVIAPEIMPGRPPNSEMVRLTMKAAYSPTSGCTCATSAKAMASGTSASATVSPLNISVLASERVLMPLGFAPEKQ